MWWTMVYTIAPECPYGLWNNQLSNGDKIHLKSDEVTVIILIFYFIIYFSFNLLLWIYPFPYAWIPLLDMWRWLTIYLSLYILTWSMDNPWIFLLSAIPMILLIFTSSYDLPFILLFPPPICMIRAIHSSIVMATCQPYLFNSYFYI